MRNNVLFVAMLAFSSFACTVEFVTPLPTQPQTPYLPTGATERPIISTVAPSALPTPENEGIVIASKAVEIRDRPEGVGVDSHNVGGYLLPGETVGELDCQQVGTDVWVYHSRGWSISRNANNVFITEVCQ